MTSQFSKNVGPLVQRQLTLAGSARANGDFQQEFAHLETAHVIGQESTYWHVKVHGLMFLWAVRNARPREIIGQLFRIVGAATKTAVGLVPQGNTGGANVSPFRKMPIAPELAEIIRRAKDGA